VGGRASQRDWERATESGWMARLTQEFRRSGFTSDSGLVLWNSALYATFEFRRLYPGRLYRSALRLKDWEPPTS